LNTSAALSSGGIDTPVPVTDRLRLRVLTESVSEGKRVKTPMRSAMTLVERDRVVERAAAGMRSCGEEADIRRMAAVDGRVGNAAEHGEVVAEVLKVLEIVRGDVVAPLTGREELLGQDAEVIADREQAPGRRARAVDEAAAAARARLGSIASRKGRASAMPAPSMKRRRDMGWRIAMNGAG